MTETRPFTLLVKVRDQMSAKLKTMGGASKRFTGIAIGGFRGLSNSILSVKSGLIALSGVAAVGFMAKLVTDTTAAANEYARWAKTLGTTSAALSKVAFAAAQQGVDFDGTVEALTTLQERMHDASKGTATYAEHFDEMGFKVTDANGKLRNIMEALPDLAKAFQNTAKNGAEKLTLASKDLIGDSEFFFSLLLREGPKALDAYGKELERIGGLMDDGFVQSAREWEKTWERSKAVFTSFGRAFTSEVLPEITKFTRALTDVLAIEGPKVSRYLKAMGTDLALFAGDFGSAFLYVSGAIQKSFKGWRLSISAVTLGIKEAQLAIAEFRGHGDRALAKLSGAAVVARVKMEELAKETKAFNIDTYANSMAAAVSKIGAAWKSAIGIVVKGTKPLAEDETATTWREGWSDEIDVWGKEMLGAAKQGREAFRAVASSLESNVTNGLMSIIEGTKSAKEAFKDMAKSILSDMARLIVKQGVTNAIGGIFGAKPAAKGGVFEGSLGGLNYAGAFKSGGIVPARPQFALVGEGGQREAVIPLGDGNKVTAVMKEPAGGGGETNNVFNINITDSRDPKRTAKEVIATITNEIDHSRQFRSKLKMGVA